MKQLALAVALGLGACAAPVEKIALQPPSRPPPASDYVHLLKKFTRHCHILADFDEALSADATFHAPEFREGYAEKWIDLYRLSADDAAKLRAQLMSDIADVWEFHLETATHFYVINDFTLGKGIWRVTLVNDSGQAVLPTDSRASSAKRDVDVAFYPYANIFSAGWRLRFPRALPDGTPLIRPDTKTIALRIAGPQGSCDMVWPLAH
jgi:hypothetical protein